MTTLGVIADTHIPDRATQLDPGVMEIFRNANVDAILHMGDVSVPSVLAQLGELAQVLAVRGNRDWLYLGHLPKTRTLTYNDVTIGMVHGHGDLTTYFLDKIDYIFNGLNQMRYRGRALETFPDTDVIVFGHLHIPVNERVGEQLLFNPGTACCPDFRKYPPSVGLLHIHSSGEVKGEIVALS